jgi:hypothetical protein
MTVNVAFLVQRKGRRKRNTYAETFHNSPRVSFNSRCRGGWITHRGSIGAPCPRRHSGCAFHATYFPARPDQLQSQLEIYP